MLHASARCLGSMAAVPGQGWAWRPGARGALEGVVPGAGGWAALQLLRPPSPQAPTARVGLGLLPFFLACAVYLLVQSSRMADLGQQPAQDLTHPLPGGVSGDRVPCGGYRARSCRGPAPFEAVGTPASSGLKPSCTVRAGVDAVALSLLDAPSGWRVGCVVGG